MHVCCTYLARAEEHICARDDIQRQHDVRVSVHNLTIPGGQIEHLDVWAVGGHNHVLPLTTEVLDIQDLVIVPCKL